MNQEGHNLSNGYRKWLVQDELARVSHLEKGLPKGNNQICSTIRYIHRRETYNSPAVHTTIRVGWWYNAVKLVVWRSQVSHLRLDNWEFVPIFFRNMLLEGVSPFLYENGGAIQKNELKIVHGIEWIRYGPYGTSKLEKPVDIRKGILGKHSTLIIWMKWIENGFVDSVLKYHNLALVQRNLCDLRSYIVLDLAETYYLL